MTRHERGVEDIPRNTRLLLSGSRLSGGGVFAPLYVINPANKY